MKLNDYLISSLHNLFGETYGMLLIFEKKSKVPRVAHISALKKTKQGAYVSLFDEDSSETEISAPESQEGILKKIKEKLEKIRYAG